ncbi:hypothetical protein [Affinirhizobium pseudoryzae]|uniref:hypothetical protein n=1 Tax=Allorhizobium pseudoryzae TaxID=379684 RepID=UPI0013EC9335|nr:hypothetical protein [Allorhizobium pseudoryzae]
MPTLIRLIVSSYVNGFLLGMLTMLGALIVQPSSVAAMLLQDSPLGLALALFAAGSSFGLGSLASAVWFADLD